MRIPSPNGNGNFHQAGRRRQRVNATTEDAEVRVALPLPEARAGAVPLTGRRAHILPPIPQEEPSGRNASEELGPVTLHTGSADSAADIVKSTFEVAMNTLRSWSPGSDPSQFVKCAAVAGYSCQRFVEISGDGDAAEQMRSRVRTELLAKVTPEMFLVLRKDQFERLTGVAARTGCVQLDQTVLQAFKAQRAEFRSRMRDIHLNGIAHLDDAALQTHLRFLERWATTPAEKRVVDRIMDAIEHRASPEWAFAGICAAADAVLDAGQAALDGGEDSTRFEMSLMNLCRQFSRYEQTGLLDQPYAAEQVPRIVAYSQKIAGLLTKLYSGAFGQSLLNQCSMSRLESLQWFANSIDAHSRRLGAATDSLRAAGDVVFDAAGAEMDSLTGFVAAHLEPLQLKADALWQTRVSIDRLFYGSMKRCEDLSKLANDELVALRSGFVSLRDRLEESRNGLPTPDDLLLLRNAVQRTKGIGNDLRLVDLALGFHTQLQQIDDQLNAIDRRLRGEQASNPLKRSRAEAGIGE